MIAALDEEEAKDLEHAFDIVISHAVKNVDLSDIGFFAEESEARLQQGILEYMAQLHGMTAKEIMEHAQTLPNWAPREE